jgi:diketogulonate reductase-like aldo/keto reductase
VNINTKYPGGWLDINEGRMIEDEKVSYRETWEGMEGLVKEGLVRNIGCCNIGTAMLRDVLSYC